MLGFSSMILIQIFLKCKTNACNDDDNTLYLFNKHGMLQPAYLSGASATTWCHAGTLEQTK
jgi:hypothetical protein